MSKLRHPERPDELETQNARMIQLIEGLVNENGNSNLPWCWRILGALREIIWLLKGLFWRM